MDRIERLRERLRRDPILVAPGCYDALTALLIEQAGFEAAYVSGASIAYTRLGRPDIGLRALRSAAARDAAAIRHLSDRARRLSPQRGGAQGLVTVPLAIGLSM